MDIEARIHISTSLVGLTSVIKCELRQVQQKKEFNAHFSTMRHIQLPDQKEADL